MHFPMARYEMNVNQRLRSCLQGIALHLSLKKSFYMS
jgi:hypothetical protein